MNVSDWIAIGALVVTIGGGALAWLIRLERRHATYLTRSEHERICSERNDQVQRSIDDLREDMERRHQENRETLDEIRSTVTGTHKRMDAVLTTLLGRRGGD